MNNSETKLALNNKDEFINNIKQWVNLDSQLKIVNEKTKLMRERKTFLNSQICEYANQNNIYNKHIEITDGVLKFYKRKEYKPLTYGFVEESLNEIIPNKEHVEFILKHLKEKRETVIHDDIRRNYT
tara:strand:- start:1523 stop:1903 length:381 start_codon:yes stop_codon:yes gene_type:complete